MLQASVRRVLNYFETFLAFGFLPFAIFPSFATSAEVQSRTLPNRFGGGFTFPSAIHV
jgi:hypothetical protein